MMGENSYYDNCPGMGAIVRKKKTDEIISNATNPWDLIDDMLGIEKDGSKHVKHAGGKTVVKSTAGGTNRTRQTTMYGKDLFKDIEV